jgi:hypothetical protein
VALATRPLTPDAVLGAAPGLIDAAHPAPRAFARWAEIAPALRAATGRMPPGACLPIGEGALESEWAVPARLAGFLPAGVCFA